MLENQNNHATRFIAIFTLLHGLEPNSQYLRGTPVYLFVFFILTLSGGYSGVFQVATQHVMISLPLWLMKCVLVYSSIF